MTNISPLGQLLRDRIAAMTPVAVEAPVVPVAAVNPAQEEITTLQALQQRILNLRWRNMCRSTPSMKLQNGLFRFYDLTVMELETLCEKDAHVKDVDLETWGNYWEWFKDAFDCRPREIHVTRESALENMSRSLHG